MQMKKIILLFLFIIPILSFGQSLDITKKNLQLLLESTSIIEFKLDSTGFSKLPRIDYFCETEKYETRYYNNWHLVDLNNDKLNDLIYSGPCLPYSQTAVFINNGKTLEEIHDYPGQLISIDKNEKYTTVNVIKKSVGCDDYTEFIEIKIGQNNQIDKHTIQYYLDTKINLIDNQLKKKIISGTIRTTPIIDNFIHKHLCYDDVTIKGNQILHIENKNVIVIYSKDGWSQVLYKKNDENSIIGWIKN